MREAADAHEPLLAAEREAGRAALDDEQAQAALALRAVGDGEDHEQVHDLAQRDERLPAVDHVVVAVARRRRADGRHVAPRVRLGDGQAADRRRRWRPGAPAGAARRCRASRRSRPARWPRRTCWRAPPTRGRAPGGPGSRCRCRRRSRRPPAAARDRTSRGPPSSGRGREGTRPSRRSRPRAGGPPSRRSRAPPAGSFAARRSAGGRASHSSGGVAAHGMKRRGSHVVSGGMKVMSAWTTSMTASDGRRAGVTSRIVILAMLQATKSVAP